jgi:transcriptional regulator with XRE-family HTH domain
MDLLISITAMNRFQREKDHEGFYLATEEDFNTAKELFTDKDAEELVKRLTARERDVINLLITNSDGLTRDEIAEKLKVAPQRITQILNGQKGYGGLSQKVQIAETKVSNSVRTGNPETDDTRHTVHKTVYSLKEYDRFTGFDAVVRLKPPKPTPEELGKQGKHVVSKEVSKQTTTSKEEVSKVSKKEKEREERDIEGLPGVCEDSSREKEKNAYLLTSEAQHTESQCLPDIYQCLPCLPRPIDGGSIEADLLRAEEERKANEAHASEQAAKYTPTRPKSYSEMAGSVPYDTSSPEAEKICHAVRGHLIKGIAPRIDFLVKETGLSTEAIESYLNRVPWIRKDDSSPAGIVVYLPIEAQA